MKRILLTLLFISILFTTVWSANVDTVTVYSKAMQKQIKAIVITPETYSKSTLKYPVLYLLHGYGGDQTSWGNTSEVKEISDTHNMIVVSPDGHQSSWYFDSPVDSTFKYETYITEELIDWIDRNYKTISTREGRAITGLSMGGHGGLYLAFRNQDIFGACGSMSGGVDIRPFPNNWGLSERLGKQSEYPENWEKNTVINQLYLLTPNSLKIIIDCGTDDFFYKVNEKLHEELLYRNIPHDYISRPGVHNWDYWKNSIKFQALFFSEYFKSTNKQK